MGRPKKVWRSNEAWNAYNTPHDDEVHFQVILEDGRHVVVSLSNMMAESLAFDLLQVIKRNRIRREAKD